MGRPPVLRFAVNRGLPLSTLLIVALAALALGAQASAAVPHKCQRVFDKALAEAAVTDSDIRDFTVAKNWDWARSGRRLVGYSAWVGLQGCKGSVVIDVSRECSFQQSYVHGACRIKGLKSY